MDRTALERTLDERFDATPGEVRAVVRAAGDLADSGRYASDVGTPLTVAAVVESLRDAPDERLPERWNWWLGSLELAFGGYAEFQIRAVER
ncbi:hypothetical protein [Halomarina ordinaria]|uniref:Uncharacterized protein n=1 Tax=Halomarina ordinaria TaxID=3033939 RepID=A0ABD5UBL3_9EURY|nr:hypothetical protein [Halomarina sp. PSRA2]